MKALDYFKKDHNPETGEVTVNRYYLEDNGALHLEVLTEESVGDINAYLEEAGSIENENVANALSQRLEKGEDIEDITVENKNDIALIMTSPKFEVFALNSEGQAIRARVGEPLYDNLIERSNQDGVEVLKIERAQQYRAISGNVSCNRVASKEKPPEHSAELTNTPLQKSR